MNIKEDELFQWRTKELRISNPKLNFPFTKTQPTTIQPTSVQPEGNSYFTVRQWNINLSQNAGDKGDTSRSQRLFLSSMTHHTMLRVLMVLLEIRITPPNSPKLAPLPLHLCAEPCAPTPSRPFISQSCLLLRHACHNSSDATVLGEGRGTSAPLTQHEAAP